MGRALTSARHSRQESATRRGSRRNAKFIPYLRNSSPPSFFLPAIQRSSSFQRAEDIKYLHMSLAPRMRLWKGWRAMDLGREANLKIMKEREEKGGRKEKGLYFFKVQCAVRKEEVPAAKRSEKLLLNFSFHKHEYNSEHTPLFSCFQHRELLLRTSFSAPLRIANRFEGCSAYLDLLELGILTWCITYTLGSVRIYESAKSLSLRFLCDLWRPMNLVEPRGRSDQRFEVLPLLRLLSVSPLVCFALTVIKVFADSTSGGLVARASFLLDRVLGSCSPGNPAMTVAHSAVQESLDCRLLFLAMKPLTKIRNVSYQITAASDPRGRLTLVRRLSPFGTVRLRRVSD
ncbi:unnamed protein product [Caenorhabditis auriculariae]|uniref:Uncharacterized protein n=1 Tax=Caenorhabditis auriculariae TaxID=2777116 RepID=A0A8S1HLY1_9PELO|nr:unnamed protein product [Caenorhabditis auriculariae]